MTKSAYPQNPVPQRIPTWWIVCAVLAGAIAAAIWASPAFAHASLKTATPQPDRVLQSAPKAVELNFSEPVTVAKGATTVVAPDGEIAMSGQPETKAETLVLPLKQGLSEGTYVVAYRVTSADGHPVSGGYTFSIGKATQAADPEDVQPPASALVQSLVLGNSYLAYVGIGVALGTGLLLFEPEARRRGALRAVAVGLSIVAGTAMAGLYLQVPYTAGSSLFGIAADDVAVVLAGQTAGALMVRLMLVVLALPLVLQLGRGHAGRGVRACLVGVAVALAATWPLAGHANTSPQPGLVLVTGTIHVAAAAAWVGGLVTLALTLRRKDTDAATAPLLRRWSTWAAWLTAALALAGVTQAVVGLGRISALWTTTYGWLVVAKAFLLAVLLLIAARARRTVAGMPAPVTGTRTRVSRVRRLVIVELCVVALVFSATAVLSHTRPAAMETAEGDAAGPITKVMETELYTLHFELEPGAVGTNSVRVYLRDRQGDPLEPIEWNAEYGQADGRVAAVSYDLREVKPDEAEGEVSLPRAGEWEFEFRIRMSKFEEQTASVDINVR